jgi:hypothetical protein
VSLMQLAIADECSSKPVSIAGFLVGDSTLTPQTTHLLTRGSSRLPPIFPTSHSEPASRPRPIASSRCSTPVSRSTQMTSSWPPSRNCRRMSAAGKSIASRYRRRHAFFGERASSARVTRECWRLSLSHRRR